MRVGKLGYFSIVFTCVIALLVALRVLFISSPSTTGPGKAKLQKNSMQAEAIPDFAGISNIDEKKKLFFDYLRPLVRQQNAIIRGERQALLAIRSTLTQGHKLTKAETFRLEQIAQKYNYRVKNINPQSLNALLVRVDIIPEPMVLIQAAKESGWGGSRFAREGFNFFGQWCYKKGCGLVPLSRTSGLTHEVAVFSSVKDSVAAYMRNLNSNAAYRSFRRIRADLRAKGEKLKTEKLVYGLIYYSERKQAYVDELLTLLHHNREYLVDDHEQDTAS